MATAWRRPAAQHDPLGQYLAEVDRDQQDDDSTPILSAAAAPAPAVAGGGRVVLLAAEEEEEEAPQPTPIVVSTKWRARLARHGIVVQVQGPPPPPPPPPQDEEDARLPQAVLSFQLALRAALRQLQGPLALLCGRGVAVPIPPLAALLAGGGKEAVAAAEARCPALPALRAALVG